MTPSERDLERIVVLKRMPLFRYLPLDTLLAVGRVLESRRYLAGETILAEDRPLEHLGILESGLIEITRPAGRERLRAPALFGELALIGEPLRLRRAVALEDSALLYLHRIVFDDLSREHPEIVTELCRLLARRLRAAEDLAPHALAAD